LADVGKHADEALGESITGALPHERRLETGHRTSWVGLPSTWVIMRAKSLNESSDIEKYGHTVSCHGTRGETWRKESVIKASQPKMIALELSPDNSSSVDILRRL